MVLVLCSSYEIADFAFTLAIHSLRKKQQDSEQSHRASEKSILVERSYSMEEKQSPWLKYRDTGENQTMSLHLLVLSIL